ncbi:putative proprotein convertase subtilisin/kexin type 5 isoform 2 [Scophthalmus maximus]|uniref:Putative proprotein convertase subtilisin/kexin type 5 isoform 2 n=1 Tax=Scophthalmus maximus TaxID=52904 RepID=A0A2U9BUL3_SCOMX|nr:putative proprotein convertase subtilisin/kexin type 5 isoform 2 [Scophthalmus maximus]
MVRNAAWRRSLLCALALIGFASPPCKARIYTNHWAVRIAGGPEVAERIADKYGYRNMGQIGDLKDHYHFFHSRTIKRSTLSSRGRHSFISMEPKVEWIQQQVVKRRIKRDYKPSPPLSLSSPAHSSLAQNNIFYNDAKWSSMWYIHCNDDVHNCQSDMNIMGAWKRGYTGKDVVVTILDDGIERNHPDLFQNYDPQASFDVNGNDMDPMPRYDATNENKHGTRCAGEVAAAANNSHCIVGIAYNARIGGVRMLDGDVTDMVEAKSLSLQPQHIDIYSASWGPDDDGKTVDGPASLARQAFENGIRMVGTRTHAQKFRYKHMYKQTSVSLLSQDFHIGIHMSLFCIRTCWRCVVGRTERKAITEVNRGEVIYWSQLVHSHTHVYAFAKFATTGLVPEPFDWEAESQWHVTKKRKESVEEKGLTGWYREQRRVLTGWPLKMTELGQISVQKLRVRHVYVLVCPPAVWWECFCQAERFACEGDVNLCDTLKRRFITKSGGVQDVTDSCGECCTLACVSFCMEYRNWFPLPPCLCPVLFANCPSKCSPLLLSFRVCSCLIPPYLSLPDRSPLLKSSILSFFSSPVCVRASVGHHQHIDSLSVRATRPGYRSFSAWPILYEKKCPCMQCLAKTLLKTQNICIIISYLLLKCTKMYSLHVRYNLSKTNSCLYMLYLWLYCFAYFLECAQSNNSFCSHDVFKIWSEKILIKYKIEHVYKAKANYHKTGNIKTQLSGRTVPQQQCLKRSNLLDLQISLFCAVSMCNHGTQHANASKQKNNNNKTTLHYILASENSMITELGHITSDLLPDADRTAENIECPVLCRSFSGRKGRGSIFVWASGNGGRSRDHCSCDGYTNSIYTISISSTAESGRKPWYLEECSSTLTTTYSSGENYDRKIITTDLRHRCTDSHTGTSASAPMAAAIIALALEANPLLSWRDVQHIIVKTSRAGHLSAPDWKTNAAGYNVSHLYGFGLMDAEAMVKEAERWRQVPSQHVCVESADRQIRTIRPEHVVRSVYKATGCTDNPNHHVIYLEHVVVRITITHPRRGDLSINLTSPSGTKSQLLANRLFDHSMEGFKNWEFMTTHCWGEKAAGDWVLEIYDSPSQLRSQKVPGKLKEWSLVLYGTSVHPYSSLRNDKPRSTDMLTPTDEEFTEEYNGPCDSECNENGCEGPGPHHCINCLHYFLKFKNNTRMCVSECPSGFFRDDRKRCKKCSSLCETCVGSRSDQCTTCRTGFHLNEGSNTCVANCADGFYLDHDSNICRRCPENCRKCNTSNICTECKPGMSLQVNKCQMTCDPGTYYNGHRRTCEPCHRACATCAGTGIEACTKCAEGYMLEDWRCVSTCSTGYYLSEQTSDSGQAQRSCKKCDHSCYECLGPGERNCSSCVSGYNLEAGACMVSTICKDESWAEGSFCVLVKKNNLCQRKVLQQLCCRTCSQKG